jgi:G3E family GTPase
VKAIEALMEKRRAAAAGKGKGKERAFDYILLETTGLADPGPIAQMFWQDEALASGGSFRLTRANEPRAPADLDLMQH